LCDDVLGQVLSRRNIEDVIKFAKHEKLFILADEVRSVHFVWFYFTLKK